MSFFPSDPDPSDERPSRLYNPYENLQIPAKVLYKLPTSPEFLFEEEAKTERRTWGENVTFYTGCGYLGGAVGGGALGVLRGIQSFEPSDTTKLRATRILNKSGHNGRVWGNRVGFAALCYAGLESYFLEFSALGDTWSSVAAGLGTGALCRAARGVRSAAVAGALGGAAAAAAVTGKQMFKRYVPI